MVGGSPKRRKGDDAFGGPDFFENAGDLDGSDANFDSDDQSGNRGSSRAKRRRKKDKKGLTHAGIACIPKGKDGADVERKPGSKSRKAGGLNDNKDLDSHLEQLQNGQSRGGKAALKNQFGN